MNHYKQFASENVEELIEEYIDANHLSPRDNLPPERELAQIFDVSRSVIRQAIQKMVNEDRLYTIRGKGTFLAPEKYIENTVSCISFTDCWTFSGYRLKNEVLKFAVREASMKIAQNMNLTIGALVYELRRLRYINETPISIETSYVPVSLYPELNEYDFNGTLSLYDVLKERYGTKITQQQQKIHTLILSEKEMKMLNNPKNDCAFHTIAMGFTQEGVCVEHSIVISRADMYAIMFVAKNI